MAVGRLMLAGHVSDHGRDLRRRGLQTLLLGLGAVATATGTATLTRGTSIIRAAGPTSANVDSEHRFMAAWWAALGPVLWAVVPDVENRGRAVRAVAGACFVGGLSRVVSAAQAGRPDRLYEVLTVVELALPPLLVAWQRAVEQDYSTG